MLFGEKFPLKTLLVFLLLFTAACGNKTTRPGKKYQNELKRTISSSAQHAIKQLQVKDSINNSLKDRFWMSSYMATDSINTS